MSAKGPHWRLGAIVIILTACNPIAANPVAPPSPTDAVSYGWTATRIAEIIATLSFSPSPSDTAAASATASLTHTASPPDEPETGAVTGEPCNNVLYPLTTGRRWTYRSLTGETERMAVVTVTGTVADTATVEILDQSIGRRYTSTVHCTGGVITGFPAIEVGFIFFQPGTLLSISSGSSMLAPAQRDLEQRDWNYSWTTNLVTSGAMSVEHNSLGEVELVFQDSPLQIEWQTAGTGENAFEAVSTHAGEFPRALKVKATARFSLTVNMLGGIPGQSVPIVLVLESSLWYQPNVGLVKQRFDSGYTEYSGITCAMEIPTQMELWEYNFA
jgi:hypothetical protein